MRFLVLGCNGMAGHIISVYLSEKGHQVTGYARKSSQFVKTVIGDVNDLSYLSSTIQEGEFDGVINCVGILNQFAEQNKANAVLVNAHLPHFLSEVVGKVNSHLVHLSTDCVFSGDRGRYTESDVRDGETFYDRTKALGEVEAPCCVTLRNSIVGPDITPNGIGLMNWFMQQKESVGGYLNAIWTGQTTLQLAKTVEAAVQRRAEGLFNMVPDRSISKYDLLMLMNKHLREHPVEVHPVENKRVNKSLIRTRFSFDYLIPDYEAMFIDLADWMHAHADMYPHYDLEVKENV